MKKLFVLLIALMAFFSCTKEASIPEQPEDRLTQLAKGLPFVLGDPATRSGEKQVKEIVPFTDFAGLIAEIAPAATRGGDSVADLSSLYVINYKNNQGYAIVSTDERLPEVFCYADEGNINENITNPGLKIFLELIPETIINEVENYAGEDNTVNLEQEIQSNTKAANQILLTTRWGQNEPFNDYSPICSSTGARMPAGCVATALAQIVAYHKRPISIQYHPDPTNSYSVNAIHTDAQWEILRNTVYGSNFNAFDIKRMVSELFTMVQYNSHMEFGCNASSSNSERAATCIRNIGYTHYSSTFTPSTYPHTHVTWNVFDYNFNNIKSDIDAYRPVYASGRQKGESSGHAWVYDGYKIIGSTQYVHCNWGWDGQNNGYYQSGIFTTGRNYEKDEGTGTFVGNEYNTDLKIIYQIRPI